LYEYQCARCGRFEVIRKFSDAPLTVCPTCGEEVHKLLSAPAIQFKGTGWYVTDYARKSGSDSKSGDSGAGSKEPSSKDSSPRSNSFSRRNISLLKIPGPRGPGAHLSDHTRARLIGQLANC
jgi:putative FmdB family regulatory protein